MSACPQNWESCQIPYYTTVYLQGYSIVFANYKYNGAWIMECLSVTAGGSADPDLKLFHGNYCWVPGNHFQFLKSALSARNTLQQKCVISFTKMDPVDKALRAYWKIIWETPPSIKYFCFNGSSKHCIWYTGTNRQRTEGTVLEKKETDARKRIPTVASFTRGRICYSSTSYKTIR